MTEAALRLVLGDQLSLDTSSLSDIDKKRDIVLLAEVQEEASYVPHHKQKLAFLFSAMRHFAQRLERDGVRVRYVALDDPENGGSLMSEAKRILEREKLDRVVVTEPGEWRLMEEMESWPDSLRVPVEVRVDGRFLCSREAFADWAEGRKTLRMEHFYREMRRKTGLLMDDDGEPLGGQWNYDRDNRKSLPEDAELPKRLRFDPDETTQAVIDMVEARFPGNFGSLDSFGYAVTAEEAEHALEDFLEQALDGFGDYQDAMKAGQPFLNHSLLSAYINAGLLDPLEVCRRAEARYREGIAPLNAVEGFIRQILGWREFIRGVYWLKMPDYAQRNALNAQRALPGFYWTGETEMRCLADAVAQTRDHAYAHHIQRLMVLGNFALLAGIDPKEVNEWFLVVYADAYEWVELPNVTGMALYADGGVFASKPYAASGKYIQRMSDYCSGCRYSVTKSTDEDACPFNALYWDFMARHEDRFSKNPRTAMPLRTWAKMTPEKKQALRRRAAHLLNSIETI